MAQNQGMQAASAGWVCLIGAGPGAGDLLTLRAMQRLSRAEVVLVDDLVGTAVLDYVPANARLIRVGKRGGGKATPQDFIQRLMLRYARQGRGVARLKGGDPLVFGRGGEELAFLQERGIPVEVVPGISAGLAVPATLGIPVTHRHYCHGVTLVTGHTWENGEPDWSSLAQTHTTLVIYMGLSRLSAICHGLLAGGLPPRTPAAVIAQGTWPGQRHVVATLGDLEVRVRAVDLPAPALIVVGTVVGLAWPEAEAAGEESAPMSPQRRVA